jgi:protein kinase X
MHQGKLTVLRVVLDDFVIVKTVGTGAFGRVVLVYNMNDMKYYAMKIFKKSEVIKYKQLDHIFSEISILSSVDFSFCVSVYGVTQDDRYFYILMEYVAGGELFTYLRSVLFLKNAHAKFYAAQVVNMIEYLHSKSIVYRDLKPENILIDNRGYLKLTDFGLAKIIVDRTYTVCGTPEYLAPEILLQKGHGLAVDWWCLGVLIYELMVGVDPFSEEDPMMMYENILFGKIMFPSNVNKDAKSLIRHLLVSDLSKRYGNLKGGPQDIKEHRWFRDFDWDRLERKGIKPFYVPTIANEGDTSNFSTYPESFEVPEPLSRSEDPFLSW